MSTPTVPFYPMTHDDAQELISAVRTKDTSNLADVYDPTTTYDVGEFCVHNNMLYKCTTAISSPEAWTAAHWSSEKVCDNLQDTEQTDKIKSDIGIVEDGNAATHAISAGQYVIWKDELYMADDAISIGETLASSGGSKNLTAKPNGLGGEIAALNSKIAMHSSYLSGADSGTTLNAIKYNYDFAFIAFTSANKAWAEGDSFGTLPVDAYPVENIRTTGNMYENNIGVQIRIGKDGSVKYDSKNSVNGRISFTAMYVIAH